MTISSIPVGSVGTLPVSLPLITHGAGNPRIAFVTGLHGGEESGVFILHKLLPRLEGLTGTFLLLPSGNPLTQAFKERFSPLDGVNPNRAFPGSDSGTLSSRIARATLEAIGAADLVIDLHCFSQNCVFTGIFVDRGDPRVKAIARNALAVLAPDVIWVERTATPDGLPKTMNLSGSVIDRGVPSIAIEMPRADHLTPELAERITASLLEVVRAAGDGRLASERLAPLAPAIVRRDLRADRSGFFLPATKPLDPITSGSVLGSLIALETLEVQPIESRVSGLTFLCARAGLVRTGDKLVAIGEPVTI